MPLGSLLLYQMCLCCRQQSRAVVKLCVMGLSCTENKLCQLSACPVMMLCLSTTVLRRGCLLCREETCILLPPPAAPEPSPCWFSALPVLGKGALMWLLSQRCQPWATRPPLPVGTGPGHSASQDGAGSRESPHVSRDTATSSPGTLQSRTGACLLPTLPSRGKTQTQAGDQLHGRRDSGQQPAGKK